MPENVATMARSQKLRQRRDQLIAQYRLQIEESGVEDTLFGVAWEVALLEERLAITRRSFFEIAEKYAPASVEETDATVHPTEP